MPSELRKALGAVKDQTSISLAKVSNTNASNLKVIILKATRHDEAPVNERYIKEILTLISSNKVYASACAKALAKRIGKTGNWIVALKSLTLNLRILQDGNPHFPKEVLHAMKRGAKILNLSSFRDDFNSSPQDYSAFVRAFAIYVDERLNCFLNGKFHRRFNNREREDKLRSRGRRGSESISDMKPAMLLDKLSCWQKLLDRVIATGPTGVAKTKKLVLVSLYAVVQESFDLYHDISDGIRVLLDSVFHLQYLSCVSAFQVCVNSVKQFEDLCAFYDLCKSIGVGRNSDYPSVQKISEELIESLREFLKDPSSFAENDRLPPHLILHARHEDYNQCSNLARESELGSRPTSLKDLMTATAAETNPVMSMDGYLEQFEKRSNSDETASHTDSESTKSTPLDQVKVRAANSAIELLALDDCPSNLEEEQGQGVSGWELILMETATAIQSIETSATVSPDLYDHSALSNLFDRLSPVSSTPGLEPSNANNFLIGQASPLPDNAYNPFLQDDVDVDIIHTIVTTSNDQRLVFPTVNDMFSVTPTFRSTPTFSAQDPNQTARVDYHDDPFAPFPSNMSGNQFEGSLNQQNLLLEQQLWLQNQDKIIAKICS